MIRMFVLYILPRLFILFYPIARTINHHTATSISSYLPIESRCFVSIAVIYPCFRPNHTCAYSHARTS